MSSGAQLAEIGTSAEPASVGLAWIAGFFFSFRSCIVMIAVRVFGTEARTGAAVELGLGLLLLGLVCFHSLGAAVRSLGWMSRQSSVRWVVGFLMFSGCSLTWSGTASLANSAAYWCGLAVDVAMVVVLFRSDTTTAVAHSLLKGFIWSTCCLAQLAWMMPVQADLRLGDEDYFNTNQIGNLCAFAIFLVQYLMRCGDGRWRFAAVLLPVTMLRSLSKATIPAFVLSESVLVIQDRAMSRKTKQLLAVGAVVTVVVFWGLFEAYYDVYTNAGNQAETLTGRTAIWAYVLGAVPDHPWIGHGFDSIWKVVPPFGSGQFEARHAENEVLQQLYAYGVCGVVLLAGLYGSLYRRLRRLPQGSLKTIFNCLLLFIVVRGLVEAESWDLLLPLWAIVVMSMVMERWESVGARPAESAVRRVYRGAGISPGSRNLDLSARSLRG